MEKYTEVVFIFASNGHIRTYFTDKRIMIVVHTPAWFIRYAFPDKIFKKENIIIIDCAGGWGGNSGVLRPDDMKEYYIFSEWIKVFQ